MKKKYSICEAIRKSIIYLYAVPLGLNRDEKNMIWRKKFSKSLSKYLYFKQSVEEAPNKLYVFTSWLQGYDNAPDIVKLCMSSVSRQFNNANYVNITKENFKDYVSLPDYIIDKWELGVISNAHFSDILRVSLLYKYGGIWIDATVLLLDSLPDFILESDLFFYQNSFLDNSDIGISNWLIKVKNKNNSFIGSIKDSLLAYWKKNDCVQDYYLFHDFVSLLASSDKYGDLWERIPYYNNIAPHMLQKELYKWYSSDRFSEIKNMSVIQKLTYKLDEGKLKKGTNLDYLLNGEIIDSNEENVNYNG